MGSFQSPHANRQKRRRLSFVMRLCLVYAAGVLIVLLFFSFHELPGEYASRITS